MLDALCRGPPVHGPLAEPLHCAVRISLDQHVLLLRQKTSEREYLGLMSEHLHRAVRISLDQHVLLLRQKTSERKYLGPPAERL